MFAYSSIYTNELTPPEKVFTKKTCLTGVMEHLQLHHHEMVINFYHHWLETKQNHTKGQLRQDPAKRTWVDSKKSQGRNPTCRGNYTLTNSDAVASSCKILSHSHITHLRNQFTDRKHDCKTRFGQVRFGSTFGILWRSTQKSSAKEQMQDHPTQDIHTYSRFNNILQCWYWWFHVVSTQLEVANG